MKIDYTTYEKPTDFVKFSEGETRIRIVSEGEFVKRHGMKTAQRFIPLGICTLETTGKCEQCAKGNEPKTKYSWVIYLPEKEQVKMLDAGPMIGDQICKIAREFGEPMKYDLLVTKTGSGKQSQYKVAKTTPSTLDEKQIAFIKGAKAFLMKKYMEVA